MRIITISLFSAKSSFMAVASLAAIVVVVNEQMPWDGLSWGRMGARGFGGGFVTRWMNLRMLSSRTRPRPKVEEERHKDELALDHHVH